MAQEHPCAQCGKPTTRPKYCSKACSRLFSYYHNAEALKTAKRLRYGTARVESGKRYRPYTEGTAALFYGLDGEQQPINNAGSADPWQRRDDEESNVEPMVYQGT